MYYIHINRGVIDSNRKNGTNNPPIAIKKGKRGKAAYAHEIELPEATKIIYSPHGTILPCGARLVIMTDKQPKVLK
jgi:hypothetical protein